MTFDPVTSWLRMTSAMLGMAGTQSRAVKTLTASREVVRKRGDIIETAMRSPLLADHAELARMVPEKVIAFASAGTAMSAELVELQLGWMGEMQNLWTMGLRGRAPTLAEMSALATRSSAYAVRSTERAARLAEVGLAPIHKQVTANARRLRKRKSPQM
ncbi:MAG: hypothetical protein V4574_20855 [Pseudomonadota bacterium]